MFFLGEDIKKGRSWTKETQRKSTNEGKDETPYKFQNPLRNQTFSGLVLSDGKGPHTSLPLRKRGKMARRKSVPFLEKRRVRSHKKETKKQRSLRRESAPPKAERGRTKHTIHKNGIG